VAFKTSLTSQKPRLKNSFSGVILVSFRSESVTGTVRARDARLRRVASLRREIRAAPRRLAEVAARRQGLHDGAAEGLPGEEQHWAMLDRKSYE
jgi:hypothetical protein